MRVALVLSILIILVSSTIVVGLAISDPSNEYNGNYVVYKMNGQNITNFGAKIDGENHYIFSSIGLSGGSYSMQGMKGIKIYDSFLTPITFYGTGTINFQPFSSVSFQNGSFLGSNEVIISLDNYKGMIISDSSVLIQGENISFTGLSPFYVFYLTLPYSYFNETENNYNQTGNFFQGAHSSYEMQDGSVANYSIINDNSSVTLFSSISMNYSGPIQEENILTQSLLKLQDSQFPSINGYTGLGSSNITLADGGSFVETNRTGNILSFLTSSLLMNNTLLNLESENYQIILNGRVTGIIQVFGSSFIQGSSLVIPNPFSSFTISIEPPQLTTINTVGNFSNGLNIAAEIMINNTPSFFSYTYNVNVHYFTFQNETFRISLYQNGNSSYLVLLPNGYALKNVTVNGFPYQPGSSTNGYRAINDTNSTSILLSVNQTGNVSITLSLIKEQKYHRGLPLFALFLTTASALIVAAFTFIYYARKKSIKLYEKDN